MSNEADTCRKYVVPMLQPAGWDDEPHRLNEQVTFTDGRKHCTKTQPMPFEEFTDRLKWWPKRKESDRAWRIRAADLIKTDENGNVASVNLDFKNPRGAPDLEYLPPEQLVEDILTKERRIMDLMAEIKDVLATGISP